MHDAEAKFAGEPNSVSAARRFVTQTLEVAAVPDLTWVAAQIISELATNAVLHAGTAFVVRVSVADSTVRLAVIDERPRVLAAKRRFSADTTTGRGLQLVERLSRAWGVTDDDHTKTVWCELVDAATADDSTDDVEDARLASAGDVAPASAVETVSTVAMPAGQPAIPECRRPIPQYRGAA